MAGGRWTIRDRVTPCSQMRLNSLPVLSVERQLAQKLDLREIRNWLCHKKQLELGEKGRLVVRDLTTSGLKLKQLF